MPALSAEELQSQIRAAWAQPVRPPDNEQKLSEKRINIILALLSKPLKYAVDRELISKAPKIGLYKVERPEIDPWDFELRWA